MKKLLTLLFISLAVAGVTTSYASAHELVADGTIGAVLHIDPADEPVAKQVSKFNFEITDTTGRFSFNACHCELAIRNAQNKTITLPLNGDSVTYTFPTAGIYQLNLYGKPHFSNAFQPFKLQYDIRVEIGSATVSSNQTNLGSAILLAGFGIGLAVVIIATASPLPKKIIS